MTKYVPHLPFQELKLVDVDAGFVPVQGDDDGQADSHLGGGDRQGEKYEHLPRHVLEIMRKRHEVDIGGVQHEFDREENNDNVSTDQNAYHSGQEDNGA